MLEEWIRSWKMNSGDQSWFRGAKGKYALVIIICLGLMALLWPVAEIDDSKQIVPASNSQENAAYMVNQRMSAALESILTKISGAGKVEVSLSLASEGLKTYATNNRNEKRTIEERDAKGSNKVTNEENAVHDLATSANTPLLLEEKAPEVIGVLVVADGARDAAVRENLMDATATLLNIPLHKVRVMPRKEGI